MEQYVIPKELDFETLRTCLDNYQATNLFIRDCGCFREEEFRIHGQTKVRESLEGKALNFHHDSSGLYLLIDSQEVFHFQLHGYNNNDNKGFSVAYQRNEIVNDYERQIHLSHGVNPDDPFLPEPKKSTLRHILDDHLLEITFAGKIPLTFHSWWHEPHFKFWKVNP